MGVLRYTPAGTPVIDCIIKHQSRQEEAGLIRQVNCELSSVALGDTAITLSKLNTGTHVKVTGFLNRKSRTIQQLVLHIKEIIQI